MDGFLFLAIIAILNHIYHNFHISVSVGCEIETNQLTLIQNEAGQSKAIQGRPNPRRLMGLLYSSWKNNGIGIGNVY